MVRPPDQDAADRRGPVPLIGRDAARIGLASTYGVAKDKMYYEPADAVIPTENVWSTAKHLDHGGSCGGITHLRRIAHLAKLYQVRTGPYGATDLSPVCMGAALHFDTWVYNFGIQEYMRHTLEMDAVFLANWREASVSDRGCAASRSAGGRNSLR